MLLGRKQECAGMPIINEIDEENPQNSRTIDTDTGVYLKLDSYYLAESPSGKLFLDFSLSQCAASSV